jgi:AraC family transcriptional activator of mtrCDE
MDLLSRLLSLMPVTGKLDIRCHFGAPWRIDQAPAEAREIQYHVLLRGAAIIEDGDGPPLPMHAGDIVLFPSGGAHVIRDHSGKNPAKTETSSKDGLTIITSQNDGEPADFLCGRFLMPAVPQQLLRDHLPGRLLVRSAPAASDDVSSDAISGEQSQLARLIELMREEALDQKPGSEAMLNHLSGALFGLALRFASEDGNPPRGLLALAQRPRLQPALSAMFDQPEFPWTLPQLAARCNMSRATFTRHFDEAIGRSASDLLTEIRMALAGRMLVQGAKPIAQIGEEVGYKSDAAFQRAFKKHVLLTPAQWRAQAQQISSQ